MSATAIPCVTTSTVRRPRAGFHRWPWNRPDGAYPGTTIAGFDSTDWAAARPMRRVRSTNFVDDLIILTLVKFAIYSVKKRYDHVTRRPYRQSSKITFNDAWGYLTIALQ
jgi:hypothetical protein